MAILVAISMIALLVAGAMVLDFGMIRVDRQEMRLTADDAVMAGLRAGDRGSDKFFSQLGVCGAYAFLKANDPDLSGLAPGTCSTPLPSPPVACNPSSPTPFSYTGSITVGRKSYSVTIQSPYNVGPSSGFPEDNYASVTTQGSTMNGCDQLGVIVRESMQPGLGSVASAGQLATKVRSVGRVALGPGDDAPAMLLLRRTGCAIVQTGSNGGGSYIHVFGGETTDHKYAQAGTIHSDSDGSSCSGGSIFNGLAANGIVAYAAPVPGSSPSVADPTKPGLITSVAGFNGVGIGTVRDSLTNVYQSGALNESGAGSAPKTDATGRPLVTRKLVDNRYLSAVTNAVSAASALFASPPTSWTTLSDCNPTSLTAAQTAATNLFVDCTDNNGFKGAITLPNQNIFFNGRLNPSATLSLPNAQKVYINGITGKPAIDIGTATFSMHTSSPSGTSNLDGTGSCSASPTGPAAGPNTTNKAELFIRDGEIKESASGGLLRMCYTTVFLMGGRSDACLPQASAFTPDLTYTVTGSAAPAPTQTPCGGTSTGTGQFTQTGGGIDWTAPNQYDLTRLSDGTTDPSVIAGWGDANGPEDLALWSESGNNSSTKYNMAGGGAFNVRGVFMTPNADSFTLSGGAVLDLRNAQFIATSLQLNGNTTAVKMGVDPNSVVTMQDFERFSLVR